MSLSQFVDDKLKSRFSNNFDFLRILGAFFVLYYHCFPLTGTPEGYAVWILGKFKIVDLGLIIFFVISGYLVTHSWSRSSSVYNYFWNRLLRLLPGLFGVALVTIFIIGPLVTVIPVADYFKNPMTWGYFKIMTMYYYNLTLPGVFVDNVLPNLVNGSIWMLSLFFNMYIIVAVLGLVGWLYKRKVVILITSLFMVIYLNLMFHLPTIHLRAVEKFLYPNGGVFAITFMVGILLYLYRDKIKYDIKIALVMLAIFLLSLNNKLTLILASSIILPYLILYVAFAKIPYVNKVGKYGDYSYGIYIYAFPVQQSVEHFIPGISVAGMFILSTLITVPLAILSFKLIESKALRLKSINVKDFIEKKFKFSERRKRFGRF